MAKRAWRGLPLAAVVSAIALGLAASPALAHPWGQPPTALIGVDGRQVVVDWRAEPDDAIELATHLGLLDPTRVDWTWHGAGDLEPGLVQGQPLEEARALHAYVLDRIRVRQDGAACSGSVQPVGNFTAEGIRVVYQCPQPVSSVEIGITMLHDLHDAYRTFAQSEGSAQPRQAVFTATTPAQRLVFGDAAAGGGYRAVSGQLAAATLLAAAIAGLAVYRRRRRLRGRPADGRSEPKPRKGVGTTYVLAPLGMLAAVEPRGFGWLEREFVKLIDLEHVGLVVGVVALVAAFGIGAAHALVPGHGKTLIGAYLIGTRGRPRDAVAFGTIVAAMHCGSVVVLGGVLFTAVSVRTDVGQVMRWIGVAAGALITAVGVGLVARQVRIRAARRMAARSGVLVGHVHGHGPGNGHGHGHELPEGVSPLSRRGLVALGVSGGLLPSPSAFLVLATAILMGRALFGLLLVAVFSIGLASTLTAFGLAAIKGRTILERRAVTSWRLTRLTAALPLVSAVAVLLGGFWVVTLALLRF